MDDKIYPIYYDLKPFEYTPPVKNYNEIGWFKPLKDDWNNTKCCKCQNYYHYDVLKENEYPICDRCIPFSTCKRCKDFSHKIFNSLCKRCRSKRP